LGGGRKKPKKNDHTALWGGGGRTEVNPRGGCKRHQTVPHKMVPKKKGEKKRAQGGGVWGLNVDKKRNNHEKKNTKHKNGNEQPTNVRKKIWWGWKKYPFGGGGGGKRGT